MTENFLRNLLQHDILHTKRLSISATTGTSTRFNMISTGKTMDTKIVVAVVVVIIFMSGISKAQGEIPV